MGIRQVALAREGPQYSAYTQLPQLVVRVCFPRLRFSQSSLSHNNIGLDLERPAASFGAYWRSDQLCQLVALFGDGVNIRAI